MRTARFQLPELLFTILGAAVTAGVVTRGHSNPLTAMVAAIWVAYIAAVCVTMPGSRVRLLLNYAATWTCYIGSSQLVEVMRIPLQHVRLLQWDIALFGSSPAIAMQRVIPPWAIDVLSFGYLSYHVWLHWSLVDVLIRPPEWRAKMGRWLFSAFALGFAGYLAFPAAPPAQAFPGLFNSPISGGWLTEWNNAVNARFAARYDAFPSLHVLITLALAAWDWQHMRRRFCIMAGPAVLMVIATLALRMHYAVDLLASLLLFLILTPLLRDRSHASHT